MVNIWYIVTVEPCPDVDVDTCYDATRPWIREHDPGAARSREDYRRYGNVHYKLPGRQFDIEPALADAPAPVSRVLYGFRADSGTGKATLYDRARMTDPFVAVDEFGNVPELCGTEVEVYFGTEHGIEPVEYTMRR